MLVVLEDSTFSSIPSKVTVGVPTKFDPVIVKVSPGLTLVELKAETIGVALEE